MTQDKKLPADEDAETNLPTEGILLTPETVDNMIHMWVDIWYAHRRKDTSKLAPAIAALDEVMFTLARARVECERLRQQHHHDNQQLVPAAPSKPTVH